MKRLAALLLTPSRVIETRLLSSRLGWRSLLMLLMSVLTFSARAEVDPNFYIYLCFGQSNMEGNATPESVDKNNIDSRFRLLATCNYDNPKRTMGEWYPAKPPLVNPNGGLGPTDYFGRTMVAALPANVKIGVIPVAMGGCPIEMFDKDKYQQKLKDNPNEWWAILAKNHYGGNPYGRLIEMAKKAKEVGVIKGVLLHQGCSNNGNPNWPNMVKKIYNDILKDLDLKAADVPLFAGETEYQNMGGSCYGHNTVVAQLPNVIPTAHVVSAYEIPGNGKDAWHFSAAGYRIFGKRYAYEVLRVMGQETKVDPDYKMSDNLKKFFTVKSFEANIAAKPASVLVLPLRTTFVDGHTEDVTMETDFSSDDYKVYTFASGSKVKMGADGTSGTVQAVYTDFMGKKHTVTLTVTSSNNPTGIASPTLRPFGSKQPEVEGTHSPIPADAPTFVYSLQGVKVTTLEQWDALPHGLYVVDGRKRLKR